MGGKYWVNTWAEVRRDEVVRLPEDFIIHDDFLARLDRESFMRAFSRIWNIYVTLYDDLSKRPGDFGMPLFSPGEYKYSTVQARESRSAPYWPFLLLYNAFNSGELKNSEFIVDTQKFKDIGKENKVKNSNILFERLSDYGFEILGLKNGTIPPDAENFVIAYPDNPELLTVFELMAEKAGNVKRVGDFLRCHYKLFKDGVTAADYGKGADMVADLMHTNEEREFIYKLDGMLAGKGYYANRRGWNEGPGYAYYPTLREMETEGSYHYWLLSFKTKLNLFLRIRNVAKCLDYLRQCPDSVKEIFRKSDNGCQNRDNGKCKCGLAYDFEGNSYWKCGCCNAPFRIEPQIRDIEHYVNLLELGVKK